MGEFNTDRQLPKIFIADTATNILHTMAFILYILAFL